MALTFAEVLHKLEDHRYQLAAWSFLENALCPYIDQDKHRQAEAGLRVEGCASQFVPVEVLEEIVDAIRTEKIDPISEEIHNIESLGVEETDDEEDQQKITRKNVRKAPAKKAPAKSGRKGVALAVKNLEEKTDALVNGLHGIWQNEQRLDRGLNALAKSERSLDHQVAVLTRVVTLNLNQLRALLGLDFLKLEEIESVFQDWNEFNQRPDANDQMRHWVMGKPLEDLPPPPEVEAKEEVPDDPAASAETTEPDETQPTIFGGDYVESENRDQAEQG